MPPGQYVTHDFPVPSAGPTPYVDTDEWALDITDIDGSRTTLSWEQLMARPIEEFTVDIHCVPTWTKLGTTWRGVPVSALLDDLESEAEFVLVHSYGGYTTNLPLEGLLDGKAWVAFEFEGEDLAPVHGGPARLVVPQRSYSIASASAAGRVELTVQSVSGGVVSPYLAVPVLLRGRLGHRPLMAMLRQRAQVGSSAPFHLVYSARTPDHVFYATELYSISQGANGVTVDLLYTRSGRPDDARPAGRLSLDDLPVAAPGEGSTRVYVCGPNGFVENAARLRLDRGHPAASIRTERFGSSGG